MIRLSKLPYWEKITVYYYENIHWAAGGGPGIIDWTSQEFNAKVTYVDTDITFNNPADAAWFMLRWA
jgi:hypothetical protein